MFTSQKSPRFSRVGAAKRGQSRCPFRARRRGAAMVEFALVAILFVSLLLGMLQFGLYLTVTNALWNLSREGARVAAVQTSSTVNGNDAIITRIRQVAPPIINTDAPTMQITITPDAQTARIAGTPVEVKIVYDMTGKIIIPGIEALLPRALPSTYETKTTMMVEAS